MPVWRATEVETLADKSSESVQVATHYNARRDFGKEKRSVRDVYALRKLNNWVKAVLIKHYLPRRGGVVLDLCCGKGGDLSKWTQHNVDLVVFADGARRSVEQALERYQTSMHVSFPARFIAADLSRVRLASIPGLYPDSLRFDAVSCQFSLHYMFESEKRLRAILQNAADRLCPGGFFFGTVPDSYLIIKKARKSNEVLHSFGNSAFKIWFDPTACPTLGFEQPFGLKYFFQLNDSIDECPEYLVHFPTLERIAKEYGLKLVFQRNFHNFFYKFASKKEYPAFHDLLYAMRVFDDQHKCIPTHEWEAIYLYACFAFQKEGVPEGGSVPQAMGRSKSHLDRKDIFIVEE